jgi:hypothetical protein
MQDLELGFSWLGVGDRDRVEVWVWVGIRMWHGSVSKFMG